MSEYETVEVPFHTRGNRRFLTKHQIEQLPWLADFVLRFPNSFEWDALADILWFIEPDLAERRKT